MPSEESAGIESHKSAFLFLKICLECHFLRGYACTRFSPQNRPLPGHSARSRLRVAPLLSCLHLSQPDLALRRRRQLSYSKTQCRLRTVFSALQKDQKVQLQLQYGG